MRALPPAVGQLLLVAGQDVGVGDLQVSRTPAVLHAALGSCIAVCLHDPEARVGGMNHILLSGRAPEGASGARSRYAVEAIDLLVEALLGQGAAFARLQVKIFGGAHLLTALDDARAQGPRNARFVRAHLEEKGLRILASDVGGSAARRVYFVTSTGEAYVRRIAGSCARPPAGGPRPAPGLRGSPFPPPGRRRPA